MSRPEAQDLAKVLARKAEDDAKAMRLLVPNPEISEEARIHDLGRLLEILDEAAVDLPPAADQLDDLSIYAVPLRYADLLDAESLDRKVTVALVDAVGKWANASLV